MPKRPYTQSCYESPKPNNGNNTIKRILKLAIIFLSILFLVQTQVFSVVSESAQPEIDSLEWSSSLLWIVVILLFSKIFGLLEKLSQPSVLGELFAGIFLGNLGNLGLSCFDQLKSDSLIEFLAHLGAIILLFQVGLESNIKEMAKLGIQSLLVSVIGIGTTFVIIGFGVAPLLLPDANPIIHIILGAALTSTSAGIIARIFQELQMTNTKESKLTLGAAVIDDILGLVVLAVVSPMVSGGNVGGMDIANILLKVICFFFLAVFLGQAMSPVLSKAFSRISTDQGTELALCISFGLFFAYIAKLIGLDPIIGAFAGGLVLDPVDFKDFNNFKIINDIKHILKFNNVNSRVRKEVYRNLDYHTNKQIEDIVKPISMILVPIFFVYVGMQVDLSAISDIRVVLIAVVFSFFAFISKFISGYFAFGDVDCRVVGLGMVPRGEVSLIFASLIAGVYPNSIADEIIVLVVLMTTIVAPLLLNLILKGYCRLENVSQTQVRKSGKSVGGTLVVGKP